MTDDKRDEMVRDPYVRQLAGSIELFSLDATDNADGESCAELADRVVTIIRAVVAEAIAKHVEERHAFPSATRVDQNATFYAIRHRADAQGRRCTSFVNAESEAEARTIARALGMVPIESVVRRPSDGSPPVAVDAEHKTSEQHVAPGSVPMASPVARVHDGVGVEGSGFENPHRAFFHGRRRPM